MMKAKGPDSRMKSCFTLKSNIQTALQWILKVMKAKRQPRKKENQLPQKQLQKEKEHSCVKAPRKQKRFTFAIFVKRTSNTLQELSNHSATHFKQNLNVQYVVELENPSSLLRTIWGFIVKAIKHVSNVANNLKKVVN